MGGTPQPNKYHCGAYAHGILTPTIWMMMSSLCGKIICFYLHITGDIREETAHIIGYTQCTSVSTSYTALCLCGTLLSVYNDKIAATSLPYLFLHTWDRQ